MIGFRYDKNEVIKKKKSDMSFKLLDGMGLSSIRVPSLWLINGLASDQGFFGGRASRFWAPWWTGNDAFFFILDAGWAGPRVEYTLQSHFSQIIRKFWSELQRPITILSKKWEYS